MGLKNVLYLIQIIYSCSQTYWTHGTCCHLECCQFLGQFQLSSLIHNQTGEIRITNMLSGASKTCCISFKSSILAPKLTELVVHVAILNAIDFWGDSSSIHQVTTQLVRLALLTYYQGPKNVLYLIQIIYSHSQTYWTYGTWCHLECCWFLERFQLDSLIHNPTGEISIINT